MFPFKDVINLSAFSQSDQVCPCNTKNMRAVYILPTTNPWQNMTFEIQFYSNLHLILALTKCATYPGCSISNVTYHNMIVVFFPRFDRFIPGFDRFIPGFDRFIPARIPVTGTLPLQSRCTLVNKICIVLYFDNILFYLIWKKYFFD